MDCLNEGTANCESGESRFDGVSLSERSNSSMKESEDIDETPLMKQKIERANSG